MTQGDAQQASPLRTTVPALRCHSGDAQQAPLSCATAPRTLPLRCRGMRRRWRRAPLHLLVFVAEDELNLRDEEVSGDLTDACASPRTAPDVVALERGPQPGGVVHPPNHGGWLLGEVQAILQIYPWSKNTRTLEI